MTEPKFTSGPWFVNAPHPTKGLAFIVPAASDGPDDEIITSLSSRPNANLIAAAPELYALVERIADHFRDTDAPLGLAAHALLAKARGEIA